MLFDNIERKELVPETLFKSLFQDMNLYDRDGSDRMRNELEAWFKKYPDEHKNDLRARFRSNDDNNHNHEGAYFELFLHELLTRLGFSLKIHPEIPGTKEHPDFLAYRGSKRCYIEATVTGLKSGPFTHDRNEQDVLDKLNTLTSPNFHITYDMQGMLTRTLSKKNVVSSIKKLLDSHNPDEVQRLIDAHGRSKSPSVRIEDGDWSLEAWLSPIAPERRYGGLNRPLILAPHCAKWLDCLTPVKNALGEKGKKYGNLDAPFVVAVHTLDSHYVSQLHDEELLLGEERLLYFKDQPDLPPEIDRKPDGIWPRESRVDAFWSFQRIDVWNMWYSASACLYLNPLKPDVFIPDALFQLPYAKVNACLMEWFEGEDIREIMEFHTN